MTPWLLTTRWIFNRRMGMVKQYEVPLISFEKTIGRDIKKTRPAVVISPNEMNGTIGTALIVPMTTRSPPYTSRIPVRSSRKDGRIMLDRIRCANTRRLVQKLGRIHRHIILGPHGYRIPQ